MAIGRHQRDRVIAAVNQRARRRIGDIAEFLGDALHTLTCGLRDPGTGGLLVEHERHRRPGDPGRLRDLFACDRLAKERHLDEPWIDC